VSREMQIEWPRS